MKLWVPPFYKLRLCRGTIAVSNELLIRGRYGYYIGPESSVRSTAIVQLYVNIINSTITWNTLYVVDNFVLLGIHGFRARIIFFWIIDKDLESRVRVPHSLTQNASCGNASRVLNFLDAWLKHFSWKLETWVKLFFRQMLGKMRSGNSPRNHKNATLSLLRRCNLCWCLAVASFV